MIDTFQDDRYCFVCGPDNPWGLHLSPFGSDGASTVSFTPERKHQGFAGVVHGGLISTLFDETMAYAAMSLGGKYATADIRVRFRAPVSTSCPIEVSAEVTERRGRMVRLKARLTQDGAERATAEGTFVQVHGGSTGS